MIQDPPILGVGANKFHRQSADTPARVHRVWLRPSVASYFFVWVRPALRRSSLSSRFLGSSLRRGWQTFARAGPLSPLALWTDRLDPSAMVTMGVERFIARHLVEYCGWFPRSSSPSMDFIEGARSSTRAFSAPP